LARPVYCVAGNSAVVRRSNVEFLCGKCAAEKGMPSAREMRTGTIRRNVSDGGQLAGVLNHAGQQMLISENQNKTGEGKRLKSRSDSISFNARIEGINYDILEELIGYAVRRAQLSIYEDFAASLGTEGITPQRFSSLVIIGSNPGISQTRLSEVMGIARSGVVSIIDSFEKAGLVERQESGDRRSYNLHLTKEGQRQLKKYKNAVKEHDNRIAQQLTASERQQLRELLGKLCITPQT
jgi:DNA-binding MarR family transcriptional regulator